MQSSEVKTAGSPSETQKPEGLVAVSLASVGKKRIIGERHATQRKGKHNDSESGYKGKYARRLPLREEKRERAVSYELLPLRLARL